MEEEVMRVIRLSPVWEPAQKDNQTVKAYRKQPITFVVVEEKTEKTKNVGSCKSPFIIVLYHKRTPSFL
jgi:hypothetical protein